MNLFLVGATGRTGQWILKSALSHRHQVTTLVREPIGRLSVTHPALKVIPGDLLNVPNLAELLAGHDAVVSALSSDTVAAGTLKMISAAEVARIPRFLGIAGGGILQLDSERLRRERPGYPEVFVRSSAGHLVAWKALEASGLSWTLLCTPDLIAAPASGLVNSLADYMPEGERSVCLGDVAEFLLKELEAPRFPNRRVGFNAKSISAK